jgi:hypothetical protein
MKTITEEEFLNRFLKISNELTYAEICMLYLLITEPYIVELSQQKFADRINSHRRTINIGMKKLKELKYISASSSSKETEVVDDKIIDDNIILKSEKETAEQVVINSIKKYYPINKKDFIINEDFFSCIIGDMTLSEKYRNDKSFVIRVVRREFPKVSFYFEHNLSSYKDYSHYYVVNTINSAIIKAKKVNVYRIKLKNILIKMNDNFSIKEEEALKIIKKEFPRVRLSNGYISIRQPYGCRLKII